MMQYLKNGADRFFPSKIAKLGFFIFIGLIFVGVSFYFGYQYGFEKGIENPKTLIIKGVNNLEEGMPEGIDFNVFWQAWQIIKDKYVYVEQVDNQKLVYGAISGLLNSLGDSYTVFMPPADAKKFGEDISGEFSGIGAEIGIRNNQLLIIAPLKNSPAEKAGLRAGDKIFKINSTSTEGLIVDEAVKLIRGKEGTTVILTIMRNSWDNPKEFKIVRQIIQIPTVDWEIKENKIAYFSLHNFYENAPFLFYRAVIDTIFSNPKGIILDLRNNPGGYLEAAVNIAGWFLDANDLVVSEEFRSGSKEEFKASGNGYLKDLPIVILINEGSASASEILAGALRDNRGAKLVGKKSFGKGTVQELAGLKDGSQIKVTVAHWITPNGQIIEKNGLTPDYEVNITDEDIESGNDPQLAKALEIIRSEIK